MSFRPVTPIVAVDILIEVDHQLIVIKRKNPPYGWAFPGGFVDIGETLEDAAVREAKEETDLNVTLSVLLGGYSRPDRDERGHTVSMVYIASGCGIPKAQDDAADIRLILPDEISDLVFDHALILRDYMHFKKTGQVAPIRNS